MTRLYSYVVVHDIGFAPNPFYGYCTLGTCKPGIRRTAAVGDWVIGTGSTAKKREGHLVYAMRISEILSFDSYWSDSRFSSKRPNLHRGLKQAFGDNVYHRDTAGAWIQENSRHSLSDGSPNPGHVTADTGVDAVLISEDFAYFGDQGPMIPDRFRSGLEMDLVHTGRGHRCKFPASTVANVVEWIMSLETGIQGKPQDW